jgi:hypothetical protein
MNNLRTDLKDKHIILSSKYYNGDSIDRVFLCTGGFGCSDFTSGCGLFGLQESKGNRFRAEGDEVERFATEEEIKESKKRFEVLTKQNEGSGI